VESVKLPPRHVSPTGLGLLTPDPGFDSVARNICQFASQRNRVQRAKPAEAKYETEYPIAVVWVVFHSFLSIVMEGVDRTIN
jgi:hypothetical protein